MKKILKSIDKLLTGGIGVLVAVILGFIYWLNPDPSKKVHFWSLIVVSIIFLFVLLFTYVLTKYFSEKKNLFGKWPQIKTIVKDGSDCSVRIIQEYSEYYSQNCLVTVFFQEKDDDAEKPIAIGVVESIRTNSNYTQIKILKFLEESLFDEKIDEYLCKNNKRVRDCLNIRPNIDFDKISIEEMLSNE